MTAQTTTPLEISDRLSLGLEVERSSGDSSSLQKGLIMFVEGEPICHEGVGFGVPAVEYSNEILFSTTADVLNRNKELVKSYSIDALQRKTWKDKFPVDNRAYRAIQGRLADVYRTDIRFRPTLNHLIQFQSLLGIKLSHQKITSRGCVDISYRLSGNRVTITVDSSGLVDKNFKRLFIFNEQSADFNLYEDEFGKLRDDDIGVWEEVKSQKACLTNQKLNVTFCVEKVFGTRLYRGRELLKPRLDWAGFCYSVPPEIQRFSYTIQIA